MSFICKYELVEVVTVLSHNNIHKTILKFTRFYTTITQDR